MIRLLMVFEDLENSVIKAFFKHGNELYNINIVNLQKEYGVKIFPEFILDLCIKSVENTPPQQLNILPSREDFQFYHFIENFCFYNLDKIDNVDNMIKDHPDSANIIIYLDILHSILENDIDTFSKNMFHQWFLEFVRTKYDISDMPTEWDKNDIDNIVEFCPQLTIFGSSFNEYITFQNENNVFRTYGTNKLGKSWYDEYTDSYELCTYFDEYYDSLPKPITRITLRSNGVTIKNIIL